MNPFETRRGVEFIDRVPVILLEIARSLKELVDLKKKEIEILEKKK